MTLSLRAEALENLPRIAVSAVRDNAALLKRVEDLALDVGGMVAEQKAAGDPQWWRHQDLLDDLLDIREYLQARRKD